MAKEDKTVQSFGNPFQSILALKDIKDKKTKKGTFRPLFDSVEAINSAVEALHAFQESEPLGSEGEVVDNFLKQLTNMQVQLLEMCQNRVKTQNIFVDRMENQMIEGQGKIAPIR